jgi:hypothetical protein
MSKRNRPPRIGYQGSTMPPESSDSESESDWTKHMRFRQLPNPPAPVPGAVPMWNPLLRPHEQAPGAVPPPPARPNATGLPMPPPRPWPFATRQPPALAPPPWATPTAQVMAAAQQPQAVVPLTPPGPPPGRIDTSSSEGVYIGDLMADGYRDDRIEGYMDDVRLRRRPAAQIPPTSSEDDTLSQAVNLIRSLSSSSSDYAQTPSEENTQDWMRRHNISPISSDTPSPPRVPVVVGRHHYPGLPVSSSTLPAWVQSASSSPNSSTSQNTSDSTSSYYTDS